MANGGVFYVGVVGPGRRATGMSLGPMTRGEYMAMGGTGADWDRHT